MKNYVSDWLICINHAKVFNFYFKSPPELRVDKALLFGSNSKKLLREMNFF